MNDPRIVSVEEAAAVLRGVNEGRVSLLQRRFLLGYQSALDLMDRVNSAQLVDQAGAGVAQSATACRPDLENVRGLVAVVREALGATRLELTGATLYSEPHTVAPGAVYLLGTNPGGSSEGKSPIGQLLERLEQGDSFGNDYYDASRAFTVRDRTNTTLEAQTSRCLPGATTSRIALIEASMYQPIAKNPPFSPSFEAGVTEACPNCHRSLVPAPTYTPKDGGDRYRCRRQECELDGESQR